MMFCFSIVIFQLGKDTLDEMMMSMGLTRELADMDSVAVSLFVLFCYTHDWTNRKADTEPTYKSDYEMNWLVQLRWA